MQPSKADVPKLVKPDGSVTFPKDVHPSNALLPIEVTVDGIVNDASEVQSSKKLWGTVVTPDGSVTDVSAEHPLNIEVEFVILHVDGKETDVKDVLPRKTSDSI